MPSKLLPKEAPFRGNLSRQVVKLLPPTPPPPSLNTKSTASNILEGVTAEASTGGTMLEVGAEVAPIEEPPHPNSDLLHLPPDHTSPVRGRLQDFLPFSVEITSDQWVPSIVGQGYCIEFAATPPNILSYSHPPSTPVLLPVCGKWASLSIQCFAFRHYHGPQSIHQVPNGSRSTSQKVGVLMCSPISAIAVRLHS